MLKPQMLPSDVPAQGVHNYIGPIKFEIKISDIDKPIHKHGYSEMLNRYPWPLFEPMCVEKTLEFIS